MPISTGYRVCASVPTGNSENVQKIATLCRLAAERRFGYLRNRNMNIPRSLLAAILFLITAGCSEKSSTKTAGPALASPLVAKCEPGVPGGRLTLATVGYPHTFNPLLVDDGASEQVIRLIFGSLIILDATTQEPTPGLAESWSVEPDGKTWTFKLRAGLRWSDGKPLTADDVVFTWNEIMYNPSMNQVTYDVFRINGQNFKVSKVDHVTIRVVTPEVHAPFLEYFGGVPIFPKHVVAQQVKERRFLSVFTANTPPARIVGCGPFRVKEVQPGKTVLLERNPEYWAVDSKGQRLPYFDEVLVNAVNAPTTTQAFLDGQSDVCEAPKVLEQEALRVAAASGKLRIIDMGLALERDFLCFNLNTNSGPRGPYVDPAKAKWFQNKIFRQAVSCGINRDRLVKEVYGGRAQPILSFMTEDNAKWCNTNAPRFSYDLARARSLLDSIGILDRNGDGLLEDDSGKVVEFSMLLNMGNPLRDKCGGLIAEDLRNLGFKVVHQAIDFKVLLARINEAFDYDCVLMGLGGGALDPGYQINVLKSDQPLHQWFPAQKTPATEWEARIDSLMDSVMRAANFTERKKSFDEIQAILGEQQPMIYTVAPYHIAAARADLANLRPSLLTPYRLTWNIEQLYFKKP